MTFKTDSLFKELKDELNHLVDHIDLDFFKEARWFQQKSAVIRSIDIINYGELITEEDKLLLPAIIKFSLKNPSDNSSYAEKYYVPLLITRDKLKINEILLIEGNDYQAYLYDGVNSLTYVQTMNKFINENDSLGLQEGGKLVSNKSSQDEISAVRRLTDVSTNSITLVKKDEIVKTFRKLQSGVNPDLEISLNLQQETKFDLFPTVRGYCYYQDVNGNNYNINLIQEFIENQGDCWNYTQEHLKQFLKDVWEQDVKDIEELIKNYNSNYFHNTAKLGRTIAQLHLALAGINKEDFKPRPPKLTELKSWEQGVKDNLSKLFNYLRKKEDRLSANKKLITDLFKQESRINKTVDKIFDLQFYLGRYMRCHGDLHLEQILKTKDDFIILDFEGEPLESIANRRRKYSPLKDIAGMLRSYDYAAYSAYFNYIDQLQLTESKLLLQGINLWQQEVTTIFLDSYLKEVRQNKINFLPTSNYFEEALALFKLEKSIYEALYEINNRPAWLVIPLQGICNCLSELDI